ncbi:MAG: LamG-like jellyroll fold domain-containing protein [Paludibacter sp.]|nr:LamG-like jellyroll fold domain-containing protein [Paludibacter sp.]
MKSILIYRKRIFILFMLIIGISRLYSATKINPVAGIDTIPIHNMINVLRVTNKAWNTPDFSTFNYAFNVLTSGEYSTQKPFDALPFDCGFVSANGTINISAPTTAAQLAVFKDINKAAVYYLCQAYMYYFYQTSGLPLLLKVGFPAYESSLDPSDAVIKTAVNAYGGTFPSFDVLNNPTTFVANNGWTIAYAFGEFMNAYKNWGYPMIINVTANSFDAYPGWFNTDNLKGLLDDFNRYAYARFLETNETLRIKLIQETEHFRIYTRQHEVDVNFPYLPNSLENAYQEFSTNYDTKAYGKLSVYTLSGCSDAVIEGIACDPNSTVLGGTAWPSGIHFGCYASVDQLKDVNSMGRHELAHAFQGFMPMGDGTQWLGEGFAFFSDAGPFNADYSNMGLGTGFWKQMLISSLERGTKFFGHRPTYEDTKIYPGYETDYGYKYLGWYLCDFIYRKGGYKALKNVMLGDLAGYQKIGYASGQAIMDALYFDFEVRLQNRSVATLITPRMNADETSSSVKISWAPLSSTIKLNVAVSTDNGTNWTTIVTNTTDTVCSWNDGNYVGKFLIKLSTPEVFDYQTTYGPFNKIDLGKPLINFPIGNEFLIAGDTVNISWANTTLSNLKFEFSGNNGTNWSTINSSVPSSVLNYKWIVPWTISNQCKIRVSDAANSTNNDLSDNNFTILAPNMIGGPYLFDKNTIALLHFDNDLNNRSHLSGNGIGLETNIVNDATLSSMLGNCYKTSSVISIPHHSNLSLTGDWTIEAWVKPTSFHPNANMYILTKPGDSNAYASNYSVEINPWWGNVFHGFYFSDASSRNGVSNYSLTLNQWYHISFIRDTKASELQILIHDKDRKLVAQQSNSYIGATTFLNSKDLLIGSGIDGYIDEVRISNVVRSFASTDVDSPVENKLLSVYPNPSKGLVKLHLQPDALNSELYITNTAGQIVFKMKITFITDFSIDLSSVSKGIYFIHIGGDGKQSQKSKLIIQ